MMGFELVEVTLPDGIVAKGLVDTTGDSQQRPVVIDFLSPRLKHRLKNGADGEAIVKAIGVKRSERSGRTIFDFTAGLGTEAFLLAQSGFSVVAFERDPMVFALLQDALARFSASESKGARIQLEFRHVDAVVAFSPDATTAKLERPFAVTLDPMFEGEATDAKSLPKKEMALLRKMLSPSTDAEMKLLFHTAFRVAESRVVVKRSNGAPDLISVDESGHRLQPAHRLRGKTARFDIYSCR